MDTSVEARGIVVCEGNEEPDVQKNHHTQCLDLPFPLNNSDTQEISAKMPKTAAMITEMTWGWMTAVRPMARTPALITHSQLVDTEHDKGEKHHGQKLADSRPIIDVDRVVEGERVEYAEQRYREIGLEDALRTKIADKRCREIDANDERLVAADQGHACQPQEREGEQEEVGIHRACDIALPIKGGRLQANGELPVGEALDPVVVEEQVMHMHQVICEHRIGGEYRDPGNERHDNEPLLEQRGTGRMAPNQESVNQDRGDDQHPKEEEVVSRIDEADMGELQLAYSHGLLRRAQHELDVRDRLLRPKPQLVGLGRIRDHLGKEGPSDLVVSAHMTLAYHFDLDRPLSLERI